MSKYLCVSYDRFKTNIKVFLFNNIIAAFKNLHGVTLIWTEKHDVLF